MLQLVNVRRTFGATVAVDLVSLDIPPGQMVGVIGRSGAGKSTLLRLVNLLVEPTSGTIRYGDRDVTALNGRERQAWRARCAMIFQQFNLVERLDVLTNVLVGSVSRHGVLPVFLKMFAAEERALAAAALERVDLLDQALQRAGTLSGGQQQRVAIARALVQQPEIILADEPIASLDPRNAKRVMDTLRRINREDGITVICNLHTLDTARAYCGRIVGMAAGRVVFDGAPQSLTREAVREIYGTSDEAVEIDEAITSTSLPLTPPRRPMEVAAAL